MEIKLQKRLHAILEKTFFGNNQTSYETKSKMDNFNKSKALNFSNCFLNFVSVSLKGPCYSEMTGQKLTEVLK